MLQNCSNEKYADMLYVYEFCDADWLCILISIN